MKSLQFLSILLTACLFALGCNTQSVDTGTEPPPSDAAQDADAPSTEATNATVDTEPSEDAADAETAPGQSGASVGSSMFRALKKGAAGTISGDEPDAAEPTTETP